MSREVTVQTKPTSTSHPLSQGGILQRKCTSCGQHKTGGGTCAKCQSNAQAKAFPNLPLIQTKLTVGQPNDKYEKEADRVAEQVMRMPAPDTAAMVGTQHQPPKIQRMCANCEEEEKLQAKEVPGGVPEVTPAVASRIQSLQGGGQPLPDSARNFFEPRFGKDFSRIRVHTDSSAQALQARAYTVGKNIVFGAGQYAPETNSGRRLLAHELVHTIQQSVSAPVDFIQRDLAVEPLNPEAVARELSDGELQEAVEFNRREFTDEEEIRHLRDVLGVSPEPPVVDENLVRSVVQWQAWNNLEQDGKIGPRTARVIGREMLAESRRVPAQRMPAVQMLERGITLSLSNNTYTDTATTSIKRIKFNVFIPRGLNMRDYALVNFIRGEILRVPGPSHPTVRMYGTTVSYDFPSEQVDSIDTDPIYWSSAAGRWNYNISGRTFSATDKPGRPSGLFNPGDSADVHFRIAVFRVRDLPMTTSGSVGSARPLMSRRWRFSVVRDAAGNITHP